MDENQKTFTLKFFLTAMAGVAAACIGGTWGFSVYFQSSELAAYKLAKEWRADEAIKQLTSLSASLNVNLEERKELLALRQLPGKIEEQDRKIADLDRKVQQLTEERDGLSATVKSLTKSGKTYTIAAGSSVYVVPNELLVGVTGYFLGKQCEIVVANTTKYMDVGTYVSGKVLGMDYRLSLLGLDSSGCRFDFQTFD